MAAGDPESDGGGGAAALGGRKLRIVHCFRAPVGGLFRHVRDLALAQANDGHAVGMIADSLTGSPVDEAMLEAVAPSLSLGVARVPIRRQMSPSDLIGAYRIYRHIRLVNPDVLHGHGAKGGAYARMIGTVLRATGARVVRIYTPHGGSLNFDPAKLNGRIYFAAERLLAGWTDGFVFVSRFEGETYAAKVKPVWERATVSPNGLHPGEFEPVDVAPDAADLVFVGRFDPVKGVDVLIDAMTLLREQRGAAPAARLVGSGDQERYRKMLGERSLLDRVRFHGPMPARQAFALGRIVAIPSLAESMPYIVLEAAAAGRPIVATNVGGIPEIFAAQSDELVPAGDAPAFAAALAATLDDPAAAGVRASRLRESIRGRFLVSAMANAIYGAYAKATRL